MSDYELILVAGLLLAAGLGAAKVADRVRVPGLLLFLGLGMLIGSEGVGQVEFTDAELTRTLGTIGLILILFEGGLAAGWNEIRPVIGTAISLATVGTILTAVIAGGAAILLFDLGTLEGLIIGAAVAATDSAAIFAVLRGSRCAAAWRARSRASPASTTRSRCCSSPGSSSGSRCPTTGSPTWPGCSSSSSRSASPLGLAVGFGARWCFRNLDLPNPGLYPVASIATAALAYGLAEVAHGSGFLSVYIAALILGTGPIPAKQTTIAFHQGLSWVAQISLFAILGLLVFPSGLGDVALEGLLLSAALIFVARPLATLVATAFSPFRLAEKVMLSWAGLRGAIPIWLATFPVIAGVEGSDLIFNAIFFVVVTSTLVQGASFEWLARRLGVTSTEPALARPLIETGTIRRLGGESFVWQVQRGRRGGRSPGQGARAAARGARQPDRPRGRGAAAARLDRDRGRRRAPRRRPARGAAGGRGADRTLARGAARRARGPVAAAARRAAGLLGPPVAEVGRQPRPRPSGSRARRSSPACGCAATATARCCCSPTAATRSARRPCSPSAPAASSAAWVGAADHARRQLTGRAGVARRGRRSPRRRPLTPGPAEASPRTPAGEATTWRRVIRALRRRRPRRSPRTPRRVVGRRRSPSRRRTGVAPASATDPDRLRVDAAVDLDRRPRAAARGSPRPSRASRG